MYILYKTVPSHASSFFFFFNDTATTEIYTLSLHDALPIYSQALELLPHDARSQGVQVHRDVGELGQATSAQEPPRSEEHTSELQSQSNLVCRLLLEKKKKITYPNETKKQRSNRIRH